MFFYLCIVLFSGFFQFNGNFVDAQNNSEYRDWAPLINQAGGLYGRILTEVVSTDWMQWGLYTWPRSTFSHTDRLSLVNKMFIIWQKQERWNSFNVTGLY